MFKALLFTVLSGAVLLASAHDSSESYEDYEDYEYYEYESEEGSTGPTVSCGGDPNAQPGCGVKCGKSCSDYMLRSAKCALLPCIENGCDCKPGYVFDENLNKCVLTKDCSPPVSCGGDPNAQPGCGVKCGKSCSDYMLRSAKCALLPCVENGCDCKPGYVFDENVNKCVLTKNCSPAVSCGGDPNAQPGCGVKCGKSCSDYMLRSAKCALLPCIENGCDCKPGYMFDENVNKCVLTKDCSPTVSCGGDPNAQPGCGVKCGKSCSDYMLRSAKCALLPCVENGCDCKPGYVFDENVNKCVLTKDCSPAVSCGGDPNAQPGCGVKCGKSCSDYMLRSAKCALLPCIENGCDCKPGYVFDENLNKCVLTKDCSPPVSCGGDLNAQPGCGVKCGKSCSDYMLRNAKCALLPCVENGCDCKPGYVFDGNLKKCVLTQDCTPTCRANEEYSSCSNQLCRLQDCTQYGQSISVCPNIDQANCKGGCVCVDGYLKNSEGICVPQEQCPEASCGGDPNATRGCSFNCRRLCSNYKSKGPFRCPLRPCTLNDCECKPDYVYDENIGKCVLPKDCSAANGTEPAGDCKEAVERLIQGNLKFTGRFLHDLVKNSTVNTIISPFSVLFPLATFALYTKKGESYNQLMSVLNLKSNDEIRCVFPEILKSYTSQSDFALELANKVYVTNSDKLTEEFKGDTQTVFQAEGESIDFTKKQKAADTINKWVAERTHNYIKQLVSPSMFDKFTQLVLANAIYFSGTWVNPFNPRGTSDSDFYVSPKKTVKVKTMSRTGSFKYAEIPSLDAKVLQMPYKGDGATYVAILPNKNNGLVDLVAKLQDPKVLRDALGQLASKIVSVRLPRYEITSSVNLKDVLKHLKITNLFNGNKSQLKGILRKNPKLGISVAVQKANINLDEKGTVAAAANAFVAKALAVRRPNVFNADHPFVYYIFLNGSPIFAGVMTGRK